jgi:hypothetical protein
MRGAHAVLRKNLQKDGDDTLPAMDDAYAPDRLVSGQVRADLLLINLVHKTPGEVLQARRRIREYGKHDNTTPLVVMAEKYGAHLKGTNVNPGGNDRIIYPADAGQRHPLLARLTARTRENLPGRTSRHSPSGDANSNSLSQLFPGSSFAPLRLCVRFVFAQELTHAKALEAQRKMSGSIAAHR